MWVSTNKTPSNALEFGRKTVFAIEIPKGCYNGTSIQEISMLNGHDDDEVLIPPYSVFIINSIEEDVELVKNVKCGKLVRMELVFEPPKQKVPKKSRRTKSMHI